MRYSSLLARYGGKRAVMNTVVARLKYRFRSEAMRSVEWSTVHRLVFICRGNVCRSPFAEAVAVREGLPAISFGLQTDQGTTVNSDASRIALALGVDMRAHRSRPLVDGSLRAGDLVLGMEPAHLDDSRIAADVAPVQIGLLGLLNGRRRTPYIHDPYGLSDVYFVRCFRFIEDTVEQIAKEWRRNATLAVDMEPNECRSITGQR
jgi:protein-tyrosine phosphatase